MQEQSEKKIKKQNKQKIKTSVVSESKFENTVNTPAVKQPEPTAKHKSILKPFFFFAIFVLLVEGAILYPFLTEPLPSLSVMRKKSEVPLKPVSVDSKEEIAVQTECEQKECNCPDVQPCEQFDDSHLKTLKATIHDLEIENLSLKERVNMATDTTPLLIELLRNIYTGRPFAKQLNSIVKQDRTNSFVLEIQKQLGPYANRGIPTNEQVESMFDVHFKSALDAFYAVPEDLTYMQRLKAYVKSLVRIYPENLTSNNAEGVSWLYLAQKQVDDNNFEGAIESIKKLPDRSAVFFNGFVKAANQRILANKIISAYFQRKEK